MLAFVVPADILVPMVTIGVERARPRTSLRSLIDARDASLRVRGSRISAVLARARRFCAGRVGAVGRALLVVIAFVFGQIHRHGLVLAGLASFVLAAALYSPIAALCVAGVSFLFLELRRR